MVIQVKNVAKTFASSNFKLKNINFTINEDEVIGIVGENGTGKSTIMKMLNYLVEYDSGEILYNNKPYHHYSPEALRKMRKEVVYIFQNANLLENKTVEYHLQLVYKLNHEKVDKAKISEVLALINLTHLRKQCCGKLSGGQKQKVAIAMAILQNPKVLLCDEISAALDTQSEQEIFKLLMDIKMKLKISIVMVAHNLMILKNLCDRILILNNQTIEEIIIPNKLNQIDIVKGYQNYVKEFFYA